MRARTFNAKQRAKTPHRGVTPVPHRDLQAPLDTHRLLDLQARLAGERGGATDTMDPILESSPRSMQQALDLERMNAFPIHSPDVCNNSGRNPKSLAPKSRSCIQHLS